jgi:hypothetical protein
MHNAAHSIGVNWIMPWDSKNSRTVRQDNVFALPYYAEPNLFQSAHGIQVVYAGNLAHNSTPRPLPHGPQHQEISRLWPLSTNGLHREYFQ